VAAVVAAHTGSFLVGALAGGVAGAAVAAVSGLIITWPLRQGTDGDRDLLVVGTIGIATLLENAVAELWGRSPILVEPLFALGQGVAIANATVPWHYFLMAATTCLLFGATAFVYNRSDLGIKLRAIAEDLEASTSAGIDVITTLIGAWALAGLLGGLGGALIGVVVPINYAVGLPLTLSGFVAAVLGGLFNPVGAFVGGLIYGISETVATGYLPGNMKLILGPLLITLVMVIRPEGLLGKRKLRRV